MRFNLNNDFLIIFNASFSAVIHINSPRLGAALVLFVSVVDGPKFR
jgi:hypothetical protein